MRQWRNEADMFTPVCFDADRRRACRLRWARLRRPRPRWLGTRARCLSDDVSGDEAVTACTAAIRKNPKDAKLYVQRGVAWSQTGDYDYAIGDFSKAIRLDPGNALAFYNLGIAREKKGELQESLVDFKRYAELRPFDPDVRTAIERVTDALAVETLLPRRPLKRRAPLSPNTSATHWSHRWKRRREPEASAPKAANSAHDDFLLFLPALFYDRRSNRRRDAHRQGRQSNGGCSRASRQYRNRACRRQRGWLRH